LERHALTRRKRLACDAILQVFKPSFAHTGGTLVVKRVKSLPRPIVTAGGEGIALHVGAALLHELADRVGLTRALVC
jgi:hypothetical protein